MSSSERRTRNRACCASCARRTGLGCRITWHASVVLQLDDGAVAVLLQLRARRVLCGAERAQERRFIPGPKQQVIAPLGIRIAHAELGQWLGQFDSGRIGHVTKAAGMGAADGDVESPAGQALVGEIVNGNCGGHSPEIHRARRKHRQREGVLPGWIRRADVFNVHLFIHTDFLVWLLLRCVLNCKLLALAPQ